MIESEENSIDPDDGNSWVCSACALPIFSTPFKTSYQWSKENDKLLLHDQCASLPLKLMDHPFHPRQALYLVMNEDSSSFIPTSCDKCSDECGRMYYACIDSSCGLRLDLLCSLQIKILHRSHEHRLMVIRGSASFVCGVCGTQHQGRFALSYFCGACDFRIHQDCASLPNAIKLLQTEHQHSLFLSYDRSSSSNVLPRVGVYLCVKCGYYVHIRCATSDPHSFQPVLIRDAKLADLLHLPMADERANLVQYMLENTSAARDDEDEERGGGGDGDDDDDDGCRHDPKLKKHSLIFHDEDEDVSDDDDDDGIGYSSRVCNACVEYISPPFYSCSKCRDFLLHSCCADLPRKIQHPFHPQHTLFLFTETPDQSSLYDPGFYCSGCGRRCSGFGYSGETGYYFKLDVVCALMPPSITHESHGKTHILHMSRETQTYEYSSYSCSCCRDLLRHIFYECSNCRQFKLHGRCALLPTTLTHKFDRHPLKLTTPTNISVFTSTNDVDADDSDAEMQHICDVCEMNIDKREWFYSCKQRDNSFHINCIPFVDRLSKLSPHSCPDGYTLGLPL
ncbi:hypothetical protein C2S53_010998 [Perilla frutescens var. hirtella]|uniref:DC1 domain-containing protein n=1 Tax=Perilla frutescens var. hirtella TaxID=608512 RepID=A0AAD4P9I8_PERFH|nr:hypothetical protein C2S53_010998 [Perilla frutescens var. hirtella]